MQEGSRDGWAELGPKNTAYRLEELWCWPLEHRHPQLFVILGREGQEVIVGQAKEEIQKQYKKGEIATQRF